MSVEYVMYEVSYTNLILLSSSLPTYVSKEDREKMKKEEVINADDPKNKAKILKMFGYE